MADSTTATPATPAPYGPDRLTAARMTLIPELEQWLRADERQALIEEIRDALQARGWDLGEEGPFDGAEADVRDLLADLKRAAIDSRAAAEARGRS